MPAMVVGLLFASAWKRKPMAVCTLASGQRSEGSRDLSCLARKNYQPYDHPYDLDL